MGFLKTAAEVCSSLSACFALAVLVGALVAAPFMWYMTDILLGVMTAINLAAIWRHRHILRASLNTLPFLKK